ncbi:MAG: hypothetical protein ACM3ZC_00495 [Bacteroidota bacterium]
MVQTRVRFTSDERPATSCVFLTRSAPILFAKGQKIIFFGDSLTRRGGVLANPKLGRRFQSTTGSEWEETGITWNNKPSPVSQVASFKTAPVLNNWMEADVTGYVTGNGI